MPSRVPRISLLSLEHCCIQSSRLSRAVPKIHYEHRRAETTFGYHQAQALVFSKHGQPAEVLEYLTLATRVDTVERAN